MRILAPYVPGVEPGVVRCAVFTTLDTVSWSASAWSLLGQSRARLVTGRRDLSGLGCVCAAVAVFGAISAFGGGDWACAWAGRGN